MATSQEILATPMGDNDAGASTIGDYLILLAARVWDEGEGFSGKRPFGNSGWQWDFVAPLYRAGIISDPDDEHDEVAGYIDSAFAYLRGMLDDRLTPTAMTGAVTPPDQLHRWDIYSETERIAYVVAEYLEVNHGVLVFYMDGVPVQAYSHWYTVALSDDEVAS